MSTTSSQGPRFDTSPRRLQAGRIEPFGEYVRRVFEVPAMKGHENLSNMKDRVALLLPYAATLYVYRSDPKQLQKIMSELHEAMAATSITTPNLEASGDEDRSFHESILLTFVHTPSLDQWTQHTLSQFQYCVDIYFSSNWDRTQEVVTLNNEYREYISRVYHHALVQSPGSLTPRSFSKRNSLSEDDALCVDMRPTTTVSNLDDVIARGDGHSLRRIIIFFHAPFSKLSRTEATAVAAAVDNIRDKYDPPPFLATVNVATQVEVVRTFEISEYPTLRLLIPVNSSLPGDLSSYNIIPFPTNGLATASTIAEWILADGAKKPCCNPPRVRTVNAVPLEKRLQFAARREAHSNKTFAKRLGCDDTHCVVPRRPSIDNPPRFIFLGGGMAAGKTTCVASLTHSEWWSKYGSTVVIVNADEFKYDDSTHSDVKDPHGHKYSTDMAEELLVTAVNSRRDIVFDSTMMWEPFVREVITMVRGSDRHVYARGRGFLPDESIEEYFVQSSDRSTPLSSSYHVEFRGAFVDPAIAVPRGILRELSTGRAVPTKQQLKSFKYFARSFETYVELCDEAILYDTNVRVDLDEGELPPIAARKVAHGSFEIVDAEAYASFKRQSLLNEHAADERELFPQQTTPPPTPSATATPSSRSSSD
jgi:predicted ABC-type ATPase